MLHHTIGPLVIRFQHKAERQLMDQHHFLGARFAMSILSDLHELASCGREKTGVLKEIDSCRNRLGKAARALDGVVLGKDQPSDPDFQAEFEGLGEVQKQLQGYGKQLADIEDKIREISNRLLGNPTPVQQSR